MRKSWEAWDQGGCVKELPPIKHYVCGKCGKEGTEWIEKFLSINQLWSHYIKCGEEPKQEWMDW